MKYESIDIEKSFRDIFDAYYMPLNLYALKYLQKKEEAEDLVQEVFVDMWEDAENFNNVKNLKPYLYRMVHNRCLNQIRSSKRKEQALRNDKDIEKIDEPVVNLIIKEEVYQQIHSALDELPPQCRKIYKMSLEGMRVAEIAEALDLSVETIKTQKKKAKRILREKLGKLTYLLFVISLNL